MRLLWPARYNKKPPAPYRAADIRDAENWLQHRGWQHHTPVLHTSAPPVIEAEVYTVMTRFCELAQALLAQDQQTIEEIRITRGITDPVALGLGVAHWRLLKHLNAQCQEEIAGWSESGPEFLSKAGVATDPNKPDTPQQWKLANRIILPEWRFSPTVPSAFGPPNSRFVCYYQARAREQSSLVKYLNPSLPKQLFGLNSLQRPNTLLWIGEGPFDVLPLIEAGESAIATLGIHLADAGIEDLRRAIGGRMCLICYDNDPPKVQLGETIGAGQAQALALHAKLDGAGIAATIVTPPDPYKDLGEWLTAVSAPEVAAIVRLSV